MAANHIKAQRDERLDLQAGRFQSIIGHAMPYCIETANQMNYDDTFGGIVQ